MLVYRSVFDLQRGASRTTVVVHVCRDLHTIRNDNQWSANLPQQPFTDSDKLLINGDFYHPGFQWLAGS